MNNNPLVSVFIVTYNSQDYIIEALESVKSQTYQNIELVVSDDCSSDGTVSIIRQWISLNQERFVRTEVVETPVNTGIPANYNRAVKVCHGEWLKMMDGDDLLLPNCVEDNIKFVLDNPEASVVFSDMFLFKNMDRNAIVGKRFNKQRKLFFGLDAEKQTRWLLRGNILPSQTCFISAKLLKNNPYNEKYRLLEDYPMWIKLTTQNVRFHYFDKCTAMYRIVDSVSSNNRDLFPVGYTEICRQFYKDIILPLIKKNKAKGAYRYNRQYFLWYDVCRVLLGNRRNIFTIPLYWLSRIVIFNTSLFSKPI